MEFIPCRRDSPSSCDQAFFSKALLPANLQKSTPNASKHSSQDLTHLCSRVNTTERVWHLRCRQRSNVATRKPLPLYLARPCFGKKGEGLGHQFVAHRLQDVRGYNGRGGRDKGASPWFTNGVPSMVIPTLLGTRIAMYVCWLVGAGRPAWTSQIMSLTWFDVAGSDRGDVSHLSPHLVGFRVVLGGICSSRFFHSIAWCACFGRDDPLGRLFGPVWQVATRFVLFIGGQMWKIGARISCWEGKAVLFYREPSTVLDDFALVR